MADKKKISPTNSGNSKAKPKKKSKKQNSKYDEKFVVNGNFEQLVKELVSPKK